MIVYLPLILLVLAALGLLWAMGLRGAMLTLTAAALAFGSAGYALQGTPGLSSQPRAATKRAPPLPLAGARRAMTGQFDYADTWLNMADALASRGNTFEAAKLLEVQAARHPGDYKLWIGLGNALTDHARTLTPAGRLAFERAAQLRDRILQLKEKMGQPVDGRVSGDGREARPERGKRGKRRGRGNKQRVPRPQKPL